MATKGCSERHYLSKQGGKRKHQTEDKTKMDEKKNEEEMAATAEAIRNNWPEIADSLLAKGVNVFPVGDDGYITYTAPTGFSRVAKFRVPADGEQDWPSEIGQ